MGTSHPDVQAMGAPPTTRPLRRRAIVRRATDTPRPFRATDSRAARIPELTVRCKRVRTRGLRRTGSIRGGRQLWKHPAWPSADHRGDDDRVTASACPCPSQSSQNITGVTARGGTLRLSRLIRVLWLIRGTGMHRINHEARIHRGNVAKAADVRVAVPRLERVAPWRRERGHANSAGRLAVEAAVDL